MAITVPNVVKAVGSGVASVTTSGVTTTAGSTFVIVCSCGAGTSMTPSDSKGNTYTLIDNQVVNGGNISAWYSANGTGGSGHTASATLSGSDFPVLHFIELAGAATTAPLDSGAGVFLTDSDGGPFTVTSNTLAQADSLVLTWAESDAAGAQSYGASGYTVSAETDGDNYWTHGIGYKVVSATTAQSATWTGIGGSVALGITAFKAAAGGTDYDLTVDPALYALTAAAQTVQVARALTIAPVSFAVTAQPVNLAVGRVVNVSPVNYSLNAADVTLTYAPAAKELTADPASYAVSAQPVTLTATRVLSIDPASYSLANSAVTLSVGRVVGSNAVSYALSASPVTLVVTRALSVDPAAYALSAPDVTLEYRSANPVLSVDPVSYLLGLADVELSVSSSATGAGDYEKRKRRKLIEELNRQILADMAQEQVEANSPAEPKKKPAKVIKKIGRADDEDELEALMLLM